MLGVRVPELLKASGISVKGPKSALFSSSKEVWGPVF